MAYAHLVKPGSKVRLSDYSTLPPEGIEKDEAKRLTKDLDEELDELEDLLYFAGTHGLLVVVQGMDTAGKDGAIRHILRSSNAVSARVAGFKVPTEEERSHDFLWRVHKQTPGRGGITIFNRSHYEDVLVVRVHGLATPEVIEGRYEQINQFESLLATNANTIIVKLFLHITKEEQEERLREREQDTEAYWKLSVGDWKEREHWDDYQRAYELALGRCSTETARWHIVPSDKKWFRNLAVSEAVVQALRPYREEWMERLEKVGAEAKAELEAYRLNGG